jgi:hypothetical protein
MNCLLPIPLPTRREGRATALAGAATLACAIAAGGEPSSTQSYYDFVHWMSVIRPDQALQQFTDDAVVVTGPACTPAAPCVGKEAIRAGYFGALQAGRVSLLVDDQRFDRWQLRTLGEPIAPGDPRLRRAYVIAFQSGRIGSLKSWTDTVDPPAAPQLGQLSEKP